MGAVHFSLDVNLVEALRRILPLETLVETGTFQGDTVAQMLRHFREIHTVEWSAELYRQVQARFQHEPHVNCANDTSPRWLRSLQPSLAGRSVLYWLDAHWCNAADTAGQDAQCPLLEELDAIASLSDVSVVLIDDARLFLSTPPQLHKCEQWPRLQPLLERLRHLSGRHEVVVVNDVLVFAPVPARSAVEEYCHAHSVDWAAVMETARQRALAVESLTAQLVESTEGHRTLAGEMRAKNQLIADLDARCRNMARPSYLFKALCRRMARLFGRRRPATESTDAPRRAA